MSSNRPLHPHPALPSATALAHAIRYNAQTCTSLARELGCSDKRISDHLRAGGFDGHGQPIAEIEHPRPRLKDSDTGYANHVGGTDRAIATDRVRYGHEPSRAHEGFDWGDLGPPPKPKSGKREVIPEPDPDLYEEPPLLDQTWEPSLPDDDPATALPQNSDVEETSMDDDTIAELIERGEKHASKRIQAAARRADEAVKKLEELISADEVKAEAQAEVDRLERQLREAKAKARGQTATATTTPSRVDSKAIRAWAQAQGLECSDSGRIPQRIVDAYDEAHTKSA